VQLSYAARKTLSVFLFITRQLYKWRKTSEKTSERINERRKEGRKKFSCEWQNDVGCTGRLRARCKSDMTAAVIFTTCCCCCCAGQLEHASRNDEHLSYDISSMRLLGLTLIHCARYYTNKRVKAKTTLSFSYRATRHLVRACVRVTSCYIEEDFTDPR